LACRNVCCDVIYILWRGKKVGKSFQGTLWIISKTYFSWERVSVDLMFRTLIILCSVMNVNFLKLISVSCSEAINMKTEYFKHWLVNKPRGPPLILTCIFVSLSTRNTNDCPVLWSIPVTWTWAEGVKISVSLLQLLYLHTSTLCLSIWRGRKPGSNNNLSGSMLIGDCLRP
jgi:hypothetical protein